MIALRNEERSVLIKWHLTRGRSICRYELRSEWGRRTLRNVSGRIVGTEITQEEHGS